MFAKKICMLGSFAVGKTSLVGRFVQGIYDDDYHSTVGVKIDRKKVEVDDKTVLMMLWDIAGDDPFQRLRGSYIKGAAGYLLVVDGTRRDTFDVAWKVKELADSVAGPLPFTVLINKADLKNEWDLDEAVLARFRDAGAPVLETSAKTGDFVEQAFEGLARAMIHG